MMMVSRYEGKFKTEIRSLILSINLNFEMKTKIKEESFKLVIFYFFPGHPSVPWFGSSVPQELILLVWSLYSTHLLI